MNPIELASSVQRMLEAQGVDPAPSLEYVYSNEHEQIGSESVLVMPTNPESERQSRRGDFIDSMSVDVAVIRRIPTADKPTIASMIDLMQSIGELLKYQAPIDESENPISALSVRVSADPLYSQEKLKQGVFLGIMRVEYVL